MNRALTDSDEAVIVASNIQEIKLRNQEANHNFAILYRTNAQSRSMEEALRKRSIPYRIYGGLSFYQRKEVKDMMAYFRVASNPIDEEALRRIINYPKRGIGNSSIDRMTLTASEQEKTPGIVENINFESYLLNVGEAKLTTLQYLSKVFGLW